MPIEGGRRRPWAWMDCVRHPRAFPRMDGSFRPRPSQRRESLGRCRSHATDRLRGPRIVPRRATGRGAPRPSAGSGNRAELRLDRPDARRAIAFAHPARRGGHRRHPGPFGRSSGAQRRRDRMRGTCARNGSVGRVGPRRRNVARRSAGGADPRRARRVFRSQPRLVAVEAARVGQQCYRVDGWRRFVHDTRKWIFAGSVGSRVVADRTERAPSFHGRGHCPGLTVKCGRGRAAIA